VSVSYVWNSRYGGISFPKKITPVLRITAPSRPHYWRATVLEVFDGAGWYEGGFRPAEPTVQGGRDVIAGDDASYPRAALNRRRWIQQRVEVAALADDHLVGASVPTAYRVDPDQGVQYTAGGIAFSRISRGSRYEVWSYAPEPGPRQLHAAQPRYPNEIVQRDLLVAGYVLPPFGAPDRDAAMREFFSRYGWDNRIRPYRALYERARRIAGAARSPYEAAAALELWLRTAGGFTYDERPPSAPGVPPLVGFVTRTKAGYCQHFAGAMALMLRYLGVPARVAAGFTSGAFDPRSGTWEVTDHDAHTWVEVWFPGFGWLPFDPTPGRGSLGASYTASSQSYNPTPATAEQIAAALGLTARAVQNRIARERGRTDGTRVAGPTAGRGPSSWQDRASGLVLLLVLVALGSLTTIALAKLVVRRARYLTRDPRRLASACRRELVDFLRDQRLEPSPGATLVDIDRALGDALAVSARHFAQAATEARFAAAEPAAAAAERSRRELRTLLRSVRRQLTTGQRARGLFSLRSLGFR
jgi:transglutaminase-like putative cysteine protease